MTHSTRTATKSEPSVPGGDIERIISEGGKYSRATDSPFEPEFFFSVDKGAMLSKHFNRRLAEHFDLDCIVCFTHGVSVALTPILFRQTDYTAYLPERLCQVPAIADKTWIKPLSEFTPGNRTLLHFHPFCSEINTLRKFSIDHAEALSETEFTVVVSDAHYVSTGDLLSDWMSDKPHIAVQNYELPTASTWIFLDVTAADLPSLVDALALGQRRDRLQREFLAGRKSPFGAPDLSDLRYIASKAADSLSAADIGIQFTPESSQTALIDQANQLMNHHHTDGNTALFWMQDYQSRAKPFAEDALTDEEHDVWRAYVTFYSAANYAQGLQSYETEPSETMDLLRSGDLEWKDVQPKSAAPQYTYDVYYKYDVGLRTGVDAQKRAPVTTNDRPPLSVPFKMNSINGHHARLQFVNSQIKYFAATVMAQQRPDHCFRWLDVGCGNGQIANSVNFEELGIKNYEVVGIDLGGPQIESANADAAWNRRFLLQDLRTMDADLMGSGFDLVTAFEVTEHLRDPLTFFKACAGATRNYLMFGSPLEEPMGPFSCEQHLYSFSRNGFEALIGKAGLDVCMSNEMRLGSYSAGHDWLTIVGKRTSG